MSRKRTANNGVTVYAVSADGQSFPVIRPQEDASPRPLTVVLNWTAEFKK
jgi:hypothetical protein